jgi:hypothetical protein
VKDLVCCLFFLQWGDHACSQCSHRHTQTLSLSHTHTPCVEFLIVGEIELRNNLKSGCCYC